MDEDLDYFLKKFGPPTAREHAPQEVIERYRGRLPDQLLLYWQELGFSGYKDGLFWLTDPAEYESAVDAWIGDTPILEEDAYHVIARSGFGELFLWGERHGHRWTITPYRGWIVQHEGYRADIAEGQADRSIRWFLSGQKPKSLDKTDEENRPLFEQAVAKFGPLARDEVFAFEPALIFGGNQDIDRVAKRNIFVHLDFLAQLGHREILDRDGLARKAFG